MVAQRDLDVVLESFALFFVHLLRIEMKVPCFIDMCVPALVL